MEDAADEMVEVRADGIYSHGHKISIDIPGNVPFPFGDGCYAIRDVAMWDEELGWLDPISEVPDWHHIQTTPDGTLTLVGWWCDGWDRWPVYQLVCRDN